MAATITRFEDRAPLLNVDGKIFEVGSALLDAKGMQRELKAWVNAEFNRRAKDLQAELEMWKAKAKSHDEILDEVRALRRDFMEAPDPTK